jgi:ribonucleoside-diphosphate reductase alpha chain
MNNLAETITNHKYAHTLKGAKARKAGIDEGGKERWENIAWRVTKNVMGAADYDIGDPLAQAVFELIRDKKFMPGGRYLYAAGRPYHQTQNCLMLRVHDSREGWSELLHKASMALMSGAGIGIDYSGLRHEGAVIRRTGGLATGPIALMQMVNECGRGIMQGGSRRSAIWAGLKWNHPDAYKLIHTKNWSEEIKALKAKDFNFPATLDQTNVSIQLDDRFFKAYHNAEDELHGLAY